MNSLRHNPEDSLILKRQGQKRPCLFCFKEMSAWSQEEKRMMVKNSTEMIQQGMEIDCQVGVD
jgi:hypothetical protein